MSLKELLKKIKSLLAKGYATKAEKKEVSEAVENLDDEEKDLVEEDAGKVEDLPEEETADDEEVSKQLKSLLAKANSENFENLKKEFVKWAESQKEFISKKAGIYADAAAESRKSMNSKFKALCSALVTGDETKMKEMTTDSTGSPYAGYVVDSELSAEIRHLMTEYGVARREMTTLQLSKGEYKANTLAADPTLFWVDEGAVIRSTEVVLNQDSLKLKKLGAIVALTRELIEDGEVDLFAFAAARLAEGFARAEDLAFFTGAGTGDTGNGEFTGVLNVALANQYVMESSSIEDLTADDLIGMVDKTPSGALNDAKYYLHRTIMSIVRTLKDKDDNYIYQPLSVKGPETIWGYPVQYSEVFPARVDDDAETPFIVFGSLRKACIFGFKGSIIADTFDAGTIKNVANNADINLITTDRKAIRWIERVGYLTLLPKAVTVLSTGSDSE